MNDEKDKKKVRQCECGRFLKKSDKKKCEVCRKLKELEDMKRENNTLKIQVGKCQTKNRELSKELTTMKKKKKFGMWLHIKSRNWDITPEYLRKVISSIAPVADTFDIEYGTYDGER